MFASNIIVRQGFTQTSWSHFTRMVKKRGSDRKALKIILRKEQFDAGGRKYHQSFTLYSLLQEFQNFESSILHDKVFALNGLATSETRIKVDYKLSRTDLATEVLGSIVELRQSSTGAKLLKERERAAKFVAEVLSLDKGETLQLKKRFNNTIP